MDCPTCNVLNSHNESVVISGLLKDCINRKDLCEGARLHTQILERRLFEGNPYIGSALVTLYAKCGAFDKAYKVLCEHNFQNVVSWNALASGYAQYGLNEHACNIFRRVQHESFSLTARSFTSMLSVFGNLRQINKGKQVHAQILKSTHLKTDMMLKNALLDMYVKCGLFLEAQQVFDDFSCRDVVTWTTLIAGYAREAHSEEALHWFFQMQLKGFFGNSVTFICVLQACGSVGAIGKGKEIHNAIVSRGMLGENIMLDNALVDMYARCGELAKARKVLDELPIRDVASWCALIAGHTNKGQSEGAVSCFEEMQCEGISPNSITVSCVLKACGVLGEIEKGKQIHDEFLCRRPIGDYIFVGNALVDMYARYGEMSEAREVMELLPHRDLSTWNTLIAGYAQQEQVDEALHCVDCMKCEGLFPDKMTYINLLKACGNIGDIEKGKQIHREINHVGYFGRSTMLDNALLDMYARCGMIAETQNLLDELPVRDVTSWNMLMVAYMQHGEDEQALNVFEQTKCEGITLDANIFVCALMACANISAIDNGNQIHDEIMNKRLLKQNILIVNALIDMYTRCGMVVKARELIANHSVLDVVLFSALIAGYGQQGQGKEAFSCFRQMLSEGFLPNAITFISVLYACSHSGLVEEGQMYFVDMSKMYGITPEIEHYTCLVDLFGRAGDFDKALQVIKKMPSSDYPPAWAALWSACRKWGNVEFGYVLPAYWSNPNIFIEAIEVHKETL